MPKYSVIESVNHNLKDYAPGDTLELEESQAKPLLELGKIKEPFGSRESTLPPTQPVGGGVSPTPEADLLQNPISRAEREAQLRELFATQGWKGIQPIAQEHGIPKPPKGWDECIPLILEKEFPPNNEPPLTITQ
jgi:hypothetical protein